MQKTLIILFLFSATLLKAQPPKVSLQPYGFDPIEVTIPSTKNKKLVALSSDWAYEYNRRKDGSDVTNVTDNSLTISAYKRNAFFYRSRGETYYQKIRYTINITFYTDRYELQFKVNEIYADDEVRLDYALPDYFDSEGNLKDGYDGLKNSIEETVNDIIMSHYNFIMNYR